MNKKKSIMELMGCVEISPGVYRHEDLQVDIDLSDMHEDKVLSQLPVFFYAKGVQDLRDAVEITNELMKKHGYD